MASAAVTQRLHIPLPGALHFSAQSEALVLSHLGTPPRPKEKERKSKAKKRRRSGHQKHVSRCHVVGVVGFGMADAKQAHSEGSGRRSNSGASPSSAQ